MRASGLNKTIVINNDAQKLITPQIIQLHKKLLNL